MRRTVLCTVFLVLFASSSALSTETLRIATFNVQEVGGFGTKQHNALKQVLARADADVVLVQEVTSSETSLLPSFASSAGYPFFALSGQSGTLSGNLQNAVLSRYPILSAVGWSAAAISGDPQANDITRNILQATIQVPQVCQPVAVFTVHLKAGTGNTNRFRRAVELIRLEKVIQNYVSLHPDHHVLLGGDFNEDVADGPFGQTFNSLPSGLPQSYHLGNDISFPVVYDPFVKIGQIAGLGLTMLDATHEDSTTNHATRPSSGRRLDYVFRAIVGGPTALGDEVLYSVADNGVDDPPEGNWLRKTGSPLPSSTSTDASDHLPVFADVLLESCDGARYGFGSTGRHLLIARAGIVGSPTLGDQTFGMRLLYAEPNLPAFLVLGQARANPPFGISLDPFVPGAFLHVDPATWFGVFPGLTDSEGSALFPLPLPNVAGLAGMTLTEQWFVADANAPNGVGNVSDAYEVTLAP